MKFKSIIALVVAAMMVPLGGAHAGKEKTKDQQAQEQIRQLQREFREAFGKGPKAAVAFLERILADEAVITENSGEAYSKAEFLQMAKKSDRESLAIEEKDLKLQVHGETVIATGLMVIKGPPREGIRFIHVYVNQRGQWKIVAAQYTAVRRP
ncbi:MAG: nuclear transport factor 2 family protein [Planctomycetes bacterium]|nr:nuclear transport factor 2 family protein [Planctomycetota bacterium]